MNSQRSLTAVTVLVLTCLLLGGFYVKRFPPWFQWAQYLSFISYSFRTSLEFGFMELNLRYLACANNKASPVIVVLYYRCASSDLSEYQACILCTNDTQNNCTLPGSEVVSRTAFPFPWYWNVPILLMYGTMFRVIAYWALRYLHQSKH